MLPNWCLPVVSKLAELRVGRIGGWNGEGRLWEKWWHILQPVPPGSSLPVPFSLWICISTESHCRAGCLLRGQGFKYPSSSEASHSPPCLYWVQCVPFWYSLDGGGRNWAERKKCTVLALGGLKCYACWIHLQNKYLNSWVALPNNALKCMLTSLALGFMQYVQYSTRFGVFLKTQSIFTLQLCTSFVVLTLFPPCLKS